MRVVVRLPGAPYWQATLFMDEPTHVGIIIETVDGLATLRGYVMAKGVPVNWDVFTNRYPGDRHERDEWRTKDVMNQMEELVAASCREADRMMGVRGAV